MTQELMNEPMRSLRQAAAGIIENGLLSAELEHLVGRGLTVAEGCVYFSEYLDQNQHLSREERGPTQHQAIVNKLHLEDYFDSTTATDWDVWCVAQGILLGLRVLTEAEKVTPLPIDVVLTLDQGGAMPPYTDYAAVSFGPQSGDGSEPSSTFRFYVHRDADCWVDDDAIYDKRDAVMILRR